MGKTPLREQSEEVYSKGWLEKNNLQGSIINPFYSRC